MSLLITINHAALPTGDLDRFVTFCTHACDGEVLFEESTPAFRHATVRIGQGVLHAVHRPGNRNRHGSRGMFGRGHVDHLGRDAADEAAFDEIRARLCRLGATDGTVFDLGPQRSFWFTDPDGMSGEVCWNHDPSLSGSPTHEPIERTEEQP